MTIQQLTAGKEIMDKISRREQQIDMIRAFMKYYSINSSDEEFELYVNRSYPHVEYVGSFSMEDIRAFSNNRIAKLEEEIKELNKELESL